jgi:hypothetical protein
MQRYGIWLSLFHCTFTVTMVPIIVLGLVALSLSGCGTDGQGGPVISSLSTPTDAHSAEGEPSDSDSTATDPEDETSPDLTATAADDFDPAAIAEPAEGEEDPTVSVTSTPDGVTARLTWDASSDPTVSNYYVYYGKQSSGEPGSCSYEASQSVETPPATISGLEPNTLYFFAISAFGESESPCSSEVLVVTPPAQG